MELYYLQLSVKMLSDFELLLRRFQNIFSDDWINKLRVIFRQKQKYKY